MHPFFRLIARRGGRGERNGGGRLGGASRDLNAAAALGPLIHLYSSSELNLESTCTQLTQKKNKKYAAAGHVRRRDYD